MRDTRRGLLLGGLGMGTVATAVSSWGPKGNATAANSAVTLGVIGLGVRGTYVASCMAARRDVRMVAICDIYDDQVKKFRAPQAATQRPMPGAREARVYRNYQDLLSHPGLDAVLITTPPYLHPEHFEAAVQARKHIYCEKPVAVSVAGANRVRAAGTAADPSKVIQFGFQQRFSPEYLRAHSILDAGQIGDLHQMAAAWILPIVPDSYVPLQGEDEKIRHWMLYRDRSGCPIVEQDCHAIDVMNWFAGSHPDRAIGTGSVRCPIPNCDWTSDHHNITYYYPRKLDGYLLSIKQPLTSQFRDVRERFYGKTGVLETTRSSFTWHGSANRPPSGVDSYRQDVRDFSLVEAARSKREITNDATDHFFGRIRAGQPLNQTDVAVESTLTALMGRMAYETGREIAWDQLVNADY